MHYGLNERQLMVQEISRKVANEKIKPIRAHLDEENKFPRELVKVMADADLCGLYIEEKYGGMGGGITDLCIATEELSRACGGSALIVAATALGTLPIIIAGSDEQKQKYLPNIAKGKHLAAFALTEPGAGSDAASIQTTATADGDYYVINGTKQWITNGGEAEVYSVIAMTDKTKGSRGASAFVIEKDTPGFIFGKKEDKLGIRASATRELIFQDCRVHKSQMLGKPGHGFLVAMKTFDMSRPGIAAQAVGIAQGALDEAVRYSRERRQFGKPISAFQGVSFMLADMATQTEAARAMLYQLTRYMDEGGKDVAKFSAMVKLFASDVAMKVTVDAVQILGGYGYMREYPVEKMMRDAKITQIYEGTNQIQREIIGLALIKEAASRKNA